MKLPDPYENVSEEQFKYLSNTGKALAVIKKCTTCLHSISGICLCYKCKGHKELCKDVMVEAKCGYADSLVCSGFM